ncbi:hypothetical protein [Nonomuraea sp. NPDC050786]|uniref:hypothetical protein n=1 Tax=Nonomuraea sp. NPDC050786 TaxID=3154840 RepID=UPI0034100C92
MDRILVRSDASQVRYARQGGVAMRERAHRRAGGGVAMRALTTAPAGPSIDAAISSAASW